MRIKELKELIKNLPDNAKLVVAKANGVESARATCVRVRNGAVVDSFTDLVQKDPNALLIIQE